MLVDRPTTDGGLPPSQATNIRDNILDDGCGGQADPLPGGLASLRLASARSGQALRAIITVVNHVVRKRATVRPVRVPLT